jgi:Na+-translocating ferredoxin:NAD+ oxidoreductase RnfC subunit
MYRCEACNKVVPAGTSQVRVVLETRKKTYDTTPEPSDKDKRRARRRGYQIEQQREFATGWEIAKEAALCPQCATAWAAQQEEAQAEAAEAEPHDDDAPQPYAEAGPDGASQHA